MTSGYDQFFKQAKKNAGLDSAPRAATSGPVSRSRFELSPEQRARISNATGSNQKLTDELRKRLQDKKKIQKRQRKSTGISWKMAGISFVGLVITSMGYFEHEKIEKVLKNVEFSAFGVAVAEEKKAAPAETKKEAKSEKAGDKAEEKKAVEEAPKKNFTDEELTHFAKLNERKRELDAREEELNRMEAELGAQKDTLEKRMQALEKTRKDISAALEDKVKTDDQKVETLTQMYSNMKPQQAAKIFEEMDEDLAVEIVGRMKKKNAAEVMNLIKPEKAKVFAEKFAGYKRGT